MVEWEDSVYFNYQALLKEEVRAPSAMTLTISLVNGWTSFYSDCSALSELGAPQQRGL